MLSQKGFPSSNLGFVVDGCEAMQLLVVKADGYDEQRSESQDWRETWMGRERASQAERISCFILTPKMCRKIEETSSKARQAS